MSRTADGAPRNSELSEWVATRSRVLSRTRRGRGLPRPERPGGSGCPPMSPPARPVRAKAEHAPTPGVSPKYLTPCVSAGSWGESPNADQGACREPHSAQGGSVGMKDDREPGRAGDTDAFSPARTPGAPGGLGGPGWTAAALAPLSTRRGNRDFFGLKAPGSPGFEDRRESPARRASGALSSTLALSRGAYSLA